MMPRPVAQYLMRFGSPDPTDCADEVQADLPNQAPLDPAPGDDCAPSIQIAKEEDGAKSNAEALSAACAEHAAALAQERLLFETRLSAERAKWTREESERLNEKIASAFAEIEANVASSAARVLRFFLIDLLRRKVVDDLAEDVGVLLSGQEHPVIEISGAEDLLDSLREKLSGFSAAIDYAPNSAVDVKVVADQTIIDSRIEAWIERIKALPE